jgi:hypothetical protein
MRVPARYVERRRAVRRAPGRWLAPRRPRDAVGRLPLLLGRRDSIDSADDLGLDLRSVHSRTDPDRKIVKGLDGGH